MIRYDTEKILNDNNLIFDIKSDITFKNIFFSKYGINYMKQILNKLFKIDINQDLIIKNNEINNKKNNVKSSFTDLRLQYDNIEFIIEMNKFNTSFLLYKNYYYLLKLHSDKCYRQNEYGKNIYTYLINVDNFDYLNKSSLIYETHILNKKYKINTYKNIKIININLECLRKKYYNKEELNELEQLLIIFIEQKKNKIKNITKNKEIMEVLDYMDKLKEEEMFIYSYDNDEYYDLLEQNRLDGFLEYALKKEETDKLVANAEKVVAAANKREREVNKIAAAANKREREVNEKEEKINEKEEKMNEKSNFLKSKEIKLEKEQNKLKKQKINLAKELKLLGIPAFKIKQITQLNINQINLL